MSNCGMVVLCAEFGERKGERTDVFGWGNGKISSHLGHVGLRDHGHPRVESRRCLGMWIKARLKELYVHSFTSYGAWPWVKCQEWREEHFLP